jgi:hypothetical protein
LQPRTTLRDYIASGILICIDREGKFGKVVKVDKLARGTRLHEIFDIDSAHRMAYMYNIG